jgi:hypothetical protein
MIITICKTIIAISITVILLIVAIECVLRLVFDTTINEVIFG